MRNANMKTIDEIFPSDVDLSAGVGTFPEACFKMPGYGF